LLDLGKRNTEVVKMLKLIAETTWRGLVVVEMRPSVVKAVTGAMSTEVLKERLASIRETLYAVFDK
jgi:hypothetical protein